MTEPAQQAALLRAARKLAPRGPLLLSFFLKKVGSELPSRSLRLRQAVRATFAKLGGAAPPRSGLGYEYGGGFVYHYTEAELRSLAEAAAYRVAHFDAVAFPHALLEPC